MSLYLSSRSSVIVRRKQEENEERTKGNGELEYCVSRRQQVSQDWGTYKMIEDNDENDNGNNDCHGEIVDAHCIRQRIVHAMDILREPIGNAPEWGGIEERHRGSQNASHRS